MKLKLLFVPRDHRDPNDGSKMDFLNCPPLGIATLTAYLRQHHFTMDQDDLDIKTATHNERKARKIDMSVFNDKARVAHFLSQGYDDALEEMAERILNLTPLGGYDVVGLSVSSPDNISTASVPLVMGKVIKEKYDATVLLGGPINDLAEEKVLASGYVDYGIIGSCETAIGEINLLEFCRAYERGTDLKNVPGVKYNQGGKAQWNWRDYSREEKFMLSTPSFEGLQMDLYRRRIDSAIEGETYTFKELVLPYFFMRGCPNNCTFCSQSREQHWAIKEPEVIAGELKGLSRRYRARHFFFHNPTMNPTYPFADKLADELIRQDVDIRWTDCANLGPMDGQLLRKLKGAGAVRLVFGFESASPSVLRMIGKPFTLDQASATLRAAYRAGIWTELDLICGFPYEREADTDATIRFLEQHKAYIMSCNLNKFWMEGRFLLHPEQFAIRYNAQSEALHKDWAVGGFEELEGLSWRERLALTSRTYEQLQSVIQNLFLRALGPHDLFAYLGVHNGLNALNRLKRNS